MGIGKVRTGGGLVERVIYDASNPLTWNIQLQEANVTITLTYPVTINALSDEGASADGQVDTTETFDFSNVKYVYVDYTKEVITQQAGAVDNEGQHSLYLDSTLGDIIYDRRSSTPPLNQRTTEVIDVSAITGSHTFYMRNDTNTGASLDMRTEHIIHSITLVYG